MSNQQTKKKNPGKENEFVEADFDAIFLRMANGESINKICQEETTMSKATFFRRIDESKALQDKYARAIEARADHMAEEILQIADETANDKMIDENGKERTNHEVVNRSRLRVDTRKWLMSKMVPKKYGDRMAVTDGEGKPLAAAAPVLNISLKKD